MSDVKPISKQNNTSQNQFQIVLKTNQNQITSKTSSTLGGVSFVPQQLDFARDVSGQIHPLFCQINFADMPVQGFPTSTRCSATMQLSDSQNRSNYQKNPKI
ncbi:YwqG-like_superfamily [Hexamita inflata]|uniref:YwqG-like superfamily n=1 Tax=Hexamita inflata TaxID=28002 RepID=A0AA86NVE5_9EUKA|nr:YwqG-like superfamily [Hexamita inflata]